MDKQTDRQQPLPSPFKYLDDMGAAAYLGLLDSSGRPSGRRMKDLRARPNGPRWIRIGKAARTRTDWLDAWAEEQAFTNTSEETARRRA
jgi:hypothetical protein